MADRYQVHRSRKHAEEVGEILQNYNDTSHFEQEKKAIDKALKSGKRYRPTKAIAGFLLLTIHDADHLQFPNAPAKGPTLRSCVKETVRSCGCHGHFCCTFLKADPFCKVEMGLPSSDEQYIWQWMFRTPTIENDHHPVWGHAHPYLLFLTTDDFRDHSGPVIRFSIFDEDTAKIQYATGDSSFMGHATLDMVDVIRRASGKKGMNTTLNLRGVGDHRDQHMGEMDISAKFIWTDTSFNISPEIPISRYPAVKGNKIKLYQDAHQLKHDKLFSQAVEQPAHLWEDLAESLERASEFIFIVGWSVDAQTRLRRDKEETMGELLVRKAQSGVQVYIMPWLDIANMMGTSHLESAEFFQNTPVHFQAVLRTSHGMDGTPLKALVFKSSLTHHQKTVCCDRNGELVSYVGGIDLTGGRFDTAHHELFRTVNTVHKDDFYSKCLPLAEKENAPREPWHDIHMCCEGPVSKDVLMNFVERVESPNGGVPEWRKAVRKLSKKYQPKSKDSKKIRSKTAGGMESQVLRSIDHDVCEFDKHCLYTKLFRVGTAMENSIQHAYIKNIMRAQNYVYIENQYFLGSATMWSDTKYRDIRANHHVPRVITEKICEKIRANEEFHVYVVIPLFPEGDPASKPSQTILFWQHLTMEAMYKRIQKELTINSSRRSPTDYLTFYFPARREPHADTSNLGTAPNENIALAVKHKRHMIYVHSKMFIVDDDYILIGSANINERSMNGMRDTEIAVHTWDPNNMTRGHRYANGQISHFRKNLWIEHLGGYDKIFDAPGSLACSKQILKHAQANLKTYTSEKNAMLKGHLCSYPLKIDSKGQITTTMENFPDTKASIKGAVVEVGGIVAMSLMTT